MRIFGNLLLALIGATVCLTAAAHHSFAVHFVGDRTVTIEGTVKEFRFRNPHGVILLDVSENGATSEWKIETNSPNILRRRGWSEDSIPNGADVMIEGYPARDGSNALRVYRVVFSDGHELVGQRPAVGIEQ